MKLKTLAILTAIVLRGCFPESSPAAAPTTKPAPTTTSPATKPATTLPATLPSLWPPSSPLAGVANVKGIAVSHAGLMAPETVHFDVMGVDGLPFADRQLHYSWNFGDAQGRYRAWNAIPAGWNNAHLYDAPGTYTVTCQVTSYDGKTSKLFGTTVKIASDTRKHVTVSTYAELKAAIASNVYITVPAGAKLDAVGVPSVEWIGSNMVLESDGTAELHCNSTDNTFLTGWKNEASDTLIRGFKVVCDEEDVGAEGGQKHFCGKGWLGWVRGPGNTVSELTFDHVKEGVELYAGYASYILVQQCSAVDQWSISCTSRWIEGCSVVEIGNISKGGAWENVTRSADFGLHRGLVFWCDDTQPAYPPPYQFKTARSWRTCSDVACAWCKFHGSWTAFNPRAVTVECRNFQYQYNTLDGGCYLTIAPPCHGLEIRRNTIDRHVSGGVGIDVKLALPGGTVDGVAIHDNTWISDKDRPLVVTDAKSAIPASILQEWATTSIVTKPAPPTKPATQPATQPTTRAASPSFGF
jgi:PKD repeat protein